MSYIVNEDFIRDNPNIEVHEEAHDIYCGESFTCNSECDYDDASNIDMNSDVNINVLASEENKQIYLSIK